MPLPVFSQRSLRVATILLGVVILLWLSFEDREVRSALLLAGFLSLLAASATVNRSRKQMTAYLMPIFGAVFGFLVPVLASLLMILKIGLHNHIVPDFSLEQLLAVLRLIPVWVGAGTLIGLGAAVWYVYRR
jgi:hypothetical protein